MVLYHALVELHTCRWQLSAVIKDTHFHILQIEHAKPTKFGTMIARSVFLIVSIVEPRGFDASSK